MKIFTTVALMLIFGITTFAQVNRDDKAWKLTAQQFCNDIHLKSYAPDQYSEKFRYVFDRRLWEKAGADPDKDTIEQARPKIQKWWERNKTALKCDSLGFNIPDGNLLKFSLFKNFPAFVTTLVKDYELDINFIDPADNKNVLEYINYEIKKVDPTFSDSYPGTRSLREKRSLLIRLGAKTSEELAKEKQKK